MALILGIDTSNYTTSAALLDLTDGRIHQAKQLLPVKSGELGLRQSDAVFHHTRQLPEQLEQLQEWLLEGELCAVGVSTRPRNAAGSYMPCFLVGLGMARGIAVMQKLPLYQTSHQIGHVLAALYSVGWLERLQKPFLALHVSGGTTDVLYCRPDAAELLQITRCGTSLDLKAGQVVDRVGLMLGLSFPCGAALEQLAAQWQKPVREKPVLRDGNCCLSGLENQCRTMLEQGRPHPEIARFCLMTVAQTLRGMTEAALKQYGNLPVLYAGGVMADKLIRPVLTIQPDCAFAEPAFACDNAVGVAVYAALQKGVDFHWQSSVSAS